MSKLLHRIHLLWESHELYMEIGVILVAGALLSLLVSTPLMVSPSNTTHRALPQKEEVQTPPDFPVSRGSFSTTPDDSSEIALLTQHIEKTQQEISRIQQDSLLITQRIQKECGGQSNECARALQVSLEERARAFDEAQERLKALTASLGNLR